MKRRSLRIQITAAVGCIVALACVALTLNSILSADNYYTPYLSEEMMVDPALLGEVDATLYEPDTVENLTYSFSLQGLGVMLLTIGASLGFTWWATGRLLRPLENLTASIRAIDQAKLSQPLKISGDSREVSQLTDSFNTMLQRLDGSFQVQKRFAADAAHELKTPLAAMKASLQVLQMDSDPSKEEYREFVQDTDLSLERLIRTVESLLVLAGSSSLQEQEQVDLRDLSESVLESLTPKAEGADVSLSLEGGSLPCSGSRTLFYRCLYNVVDNAIKYNRTGGRVTLRLKQEVNWAAVEVSDTGTGISQEELPSIFDPFYRADPSRSQAIEGAGLGLAIVRRVMERYGGEVRARSTPGIGTTITLRFRSQPTSVSASNEENSSIE